MEKDYSKLISRVNYMKALVIRGSYSIRTKTLKLKTRKFTGYKTIVFLKCNDNQKFNLDFTITQGEAEVYLISRNKEAILLADNSCNKEIATNVSKGKYYVRIVGDHTSFDLCLTKII